MKKKKELLDATQPASQQHRQQQPQQTTTLVASTPGASVPTGINVHDKDSPPSRVVQTSPLRRSPRRHASTYVLDRMVMGNNDRDARGRSLDQPFTSPVRRNTKAKRQPNLPSVAAKDVGPSNTDTPGSRDASIPPPTKKRKFTTALSAAALVMEENLRKQKIHDEKERARRVFSGSSSQASSSNNRNPAQKDASGNSCSQQAPDLPTEPAATMDSTLGQDSAGMLDDFLMNASPGTAINSVLGHALPFDLSLDYSVSNALPRSPLSKQNLDKLLALNNDTGVQETPGRILSRYVEDLVTHQRRNSDTDHAMLQSGQQTPNNALTPYRTTHGRLGRSLSEQPPLTLTAPAAHPYIQDRLRLHSALSSDELHERTDGPKLQIHLLPPTADRGRAARSHTTQLNDGLGLGSDHLLHSDSMDCAMDPFSDSIVDDFQSFLLKTGSSLFSPTVTRETSEPTTTATWEPGQAPSGSTQQEEPRLAPIPYPASVSARRLWNPQAAAKPSLHLRGQTAHQAPAPSSDFDFDIRNLPPSSPPPLPAPYDANAASQYLGGQAGYHSYPMAARVHDRDDAQSPISVTTTVTAAGTPQEAPLHQQTSVGPSAAHIATVSSQSIATPASQSMPTGPCKCIKRRLQYRIDYVCFAHATDLRLTTGVPHSQ